MILSQLDYRTEEDVPLAVPGCGTWLHSGEMTLSCASKNKPLLGQKFSSATEPKVLLASLVQRWYLVLEQCSET